MLRQEVARALVEAHARFDVPWSWRAPPPILSLSSPRFTISRHFGALHSPFFSALIFSAYASLHRRRKRLRCYLIWMLQYLFRALPRLDQLIGHLGLIPLWYRVVVLEYFDDVVTIGRAEENGKKRVAVIYAIGHEFFHFVIANAVVKVFKLRVAKAKLRHPLRQVFSEHFVVA